jgi:NitT/TauT family transport system substrate-binding protein
VAKDQGYYEEEGVTPTFEGLDGSAAAIQAALSGKAQLAMSAPDNYLTAASSGADVTGLYSFYTSQAFFLVTPTDSDISSLDDIAGTTVGISTPGGGDVTYATSLLKLGADLKADADYKQLAVGDGGAAATALQKGAIDAYSASYFDEEIIKAGGVELRQLSTPDYPDVVGDLLVGNTTWVDDNSDVIEGLGRAVARGTEYGLANRDEVIDACSTEAPEETEDEAFARVIVDRVAGLVEPLESADGQFGHIDEAAWDEYRDLLIGLDIVGDGASELGVDNSFVDAWNS